MNKAPLKTTPDGYFILEDVWNINPIRKNCNATLLSLLEIQKQPSLKKIKIKIVTVFFYAVEFFFVILSEFGISSDN